MECLGAISHSQPESLHPHLFYLQYFPMLDANWESLCPELLLSKLIYIQLSDGVSAQSLSLESRRSHLILPNTPHLSLFSVPPLSHLFVCLLAH